MTESSLEKKSKWKITNSFHVFKNWSSWWILSVVLLCISSVRMAVHISHLRREKCNINWKGFFVKEMKKYLIHKAFQTLAFVVNTRVRAYKWGFQCLFVAHLKTYLPWVSIMLVFTAIALSGVDVTYFAHGVLWDWNADKSPLQTYTMFRDSQYFQFKSVQIDRHVVSLCSRLAKQKESFFLQVLFVIFSMSKLHSPQQQYLMELLITISSAIDWF